MFKRIAISLLAASAVYGKSIGAAVVTQTNATPAAAAPAAAPAVDTAATAATTATAPAAGASRFTEAELAAAAPAKIYQYCQKPGQFVLTFDDGPNPATTPRALEYLRNNNLKATFFINGVNYGDVENDPAAVNLIKQEYQEGHDIGSHTYYHKDLFEAIPEGTMELNIDKLSDKIEEIIGVKPALFRPPCGSGAYEETDPVKKVYNEKVQKYLGASGYNIIMWGTDTRDWEYKDDVEKVIAELNQQLTAPGVSPATHSFISLMHDVHPTTVDTVLPAVVEYVKSLGYQFVPLTECLGISSAYQTTLNDGLNSNLNNNLSTDTTTNASVNAINASTDGTRSLNDANANGQTTADKSDASSIEVKMIYSTLAIILSLFFIF